MDKRRYKIGDEVVTLEIRPVKVEVTKYEAVLVREGEADLLLNGEANRLNTYDTSDLGMVHGMVTLEQSCKDSGVEFKRL